MNTPILFRLALTLTASIALFACTEVRPLPGHTNPLDPEFVAVASSSSQETASSSVATAPSSSSASIAQGTGDLWTPALGGQVATGGWWWSGDDQAGSSVTPSIFNGPTLATTIADCGGNSLCATMTLASLEFSSPVAEMGILFLDSPASYDMGNKGICVAYQSDQPLRLRFRYSAGIEQTMEYDTPGWNLPQAGSCNKWYQTAASAQTLGTGFQVANNLSIVQGISFQFTGAMGEASKIAHLNIFSLGFGVSCTCP